MTANCSLVRRARPVVVAAFSLFAFALFAADGENLLNAGAFETGETNGVPTGWNLWSSTTLQDPLRKIELVEESGGNHFVRLRDNNTLPPELPAVNFLLIQAAVPLKPDQDKVVLSYRMKALVSAIGSHEIFGPRIRIHFELNDGKRHIQNSKAQIKDMSNWTKLTETVDVPKGATRAVLLAGLFGCTGYVCFDDIQMSTP